MTTSYGKTREPGNTPQQVDENIQVKSFSQGIQQPILVVGLFVWGLGMYVWLKCFPFFPVGLIWTIAVWWTGGWFKDILVRTFFKVDYLGRIPRLIFVVSLGIILSLLPVRALLSIEPYCPEPNEFSYRLKQERGPLSWEVSLRTSLPLMMDKLDREYHVSWISDFLRGYFRAFRFPLDERLKSYLRSAYEEVKGRIEVTVSIGPSLESLLLRGESKEVQPYWVVPDNFQDQIALWLNGAHSIRPVIAKTEPWKSRTLREFPDQFRQTFVFSLPLDQNKLWGIHATERLGFAIGVTNSGESLLFDFPLPIRFSEVVAANRSEFKKENHWIEFIRHFFSTDDKENAVPRIFRRIFPRLDFSTFPVLKKTENHMSAMSIPNESVEGRGQHIVDVIIILSCLGTALAFMPFLIRQALPKRASKSQSSGEFWQGSEADLQRRDRRTMNIWQVVILCCGLVALLVALMTSPKAVYVAGFRIRADQVPHHMLKQLAPVIDVPATAFRAGIVIGVTGLLYYLVRSRR